MNTDLPVPERVLPPQAADRIRAAILSEEPERDRSVSRWMLGLAAAVVVIVLLTAAALLWPGASRTQIVATPTPTASASPTPTASRVGPTPPQSPGPASSQAPFQTYRSSVGVATARRLLQRRCLDGKPVTGTVLEAFRASDGVRDFTVILYRADDGRTWQCVYGSSFTPLETNHRVVPSAKTPVITRPGSQRGENGGVQVQWVYRALPSVKRIQVRALIEGRSTRWFESEVHEGLAFVPTYTPGDFDPATDDFPLFFEHRAFDKDGRAVPVRVVEP
jgi:hypothetical protein